MNPVTLPADVSLHHAPWVWGTRAVNYFGPISSEVFLENADRSALAIEQAAHQILDLLQSRASRLGANAVVGLEITVNPFAEREQDGANGVLFQAIGTAGLLERIL